MLCRSTWFEKGSSFVDIFIATTSSAEKLAVLTSNYPQKTSFSLVVAARKKLLSEKVAYLKK